MVASVIKEEMEERAVMPHLPRASTMGNFLADVASQPDHQLDSGAYKEALLNPPVALAHETNETEAQSLQLPVLSIQNVSLTRSPNSGATIIKGPSTHLDLRHGPNATSASRATAHLPTFRPKLSIIPENQVDVKEEERQEKKETTSRNAGVSTPGTSHPAVPKESSSQQDTKPGLVAASASGATACAPSHRPHLSESGNSRAIKLEGVDPTTISNPQPGSAAPQGYPRRRLANHEPTLSDQIIRVMRTSRREGR